MADDRHVPDRWADEIRATLVPMLNEANVVISFVPPGQIDIEFAVELGLSVIMDKPIIALVRPGTRLSDKLVRVADEIIEVSGTDLAGGGIRSARLDEAMQRVRRRHGGEE